MRIKAITTEVVSVVKSHPLLAVGGLAIVGLFAYGHVAQSNAASAQEATTTIDPNSYLGYGLSSALGYSAPVSMGTGSSADSTDTSVAVSNGLGVSSTDLLDFEKLKENHSYELSMETLQTQADIAAANAAISAAGISSANYQAASALAQTFMLSGNDLGGGIVQGPGGTNLVYSFANHSVDTSTYGQATNRFENEIRGQAIENFLGQAQRAITSVNGALPAAPQTPAIAVSTSA